MNIYNKKKNNKGFTLVEMLVAVFIFTVAMSALTVMAGKGIRASSSAQKRVTADFLAIEALEVVRNLRDTSLLQGNSTSTWTGVFGGSNQFDFDECFNEINDSDQNKTCTFIYDSSGKPNLTSCTSCFVYLGNNGYQNGPVGGGQVAFTRKIYINQVANNEIRVRVTVEWGENEIVELQTNLLLWG